MPALATDLPGACARCTAEGTLTPPKQIDYRTALGRIQAIEARYPEPRSDGERGTPSHRPRWVLDLWDEETQKLLAGRPLINRPVSVHAVLCRSQRAPTTERPTSGCGLSR